MEKANPHQASDEYCAGVVDSDGCISRSDAYVRVQVTNTDKRLCDLFFVRFGGSVYSYKGHYKNGKLIYCWMVSGKSAIEALRAIEPHLVLKRDKAIAGIESLNIKDRAERRQFLKDNVMYSDLSAGATTKWSDADVE